MTNSKQSLIQKLQDASYHKPGSNTRGLDLDEVISIVRQHESSMYKKMPFPIHENAKCIETIMLETVRLYKKLNLSSAFLKPGLVSSANAECIETGHIASEIPVVDEREAFLEWFKNHGDHDDSSLTAWILWQFLRSTKGIPTKWMPLPNPPVSEIEDGGAK